MVGLFPSNFVEVLPDDFRPVNRSVSPLPVRKSTPPQKSKTFRKPFEAYAKAPHYSTAKQPEVVREPPLRAREPSREPSRVRESSTVRDMSRTREASRISDASRVRDTSRAREAFTRDSTTPMPVTPGRNLSVQDDIDSMRTPQTQVRSVHEAMGRVRAPLSYSQGSRQPSPAPSFNSQLHQQYLPPVDADDDDAPPPPPPPHRHIAAGVSRHGSSLSYDSQISSRTPIDVGRHGSHLSYDSRIPNDLSRHGSQASYDNRIPDDIAHRGSHATYDSHIEPDLSRQPSHASYDDRTQYEPYRRPDTAPDPRAGYHTPRGPSPNPSNAGSGMNMTPSPLREAMDGVMEQLDALGVSREPDPEPESPQVPLDPWSPESFDLVNQKSRRQKNKPVRPQTSMALTQNDSGYGTGSGASSQVHANSGGYSQDGRPPELTNYVQRMESRFQDMHAHNNVSMAGEEDDDDDDDEAPPPPPKGRTFERPKSSMDTRADGSDRRLRNKRSTYDVGKILGRTFTNKTNSTSASSKTNSSSNTQSTNRSLMSGVSAGGISATSAASMARKSRNRAQSALGSRDLGLDRPETPFTGVSYHSSHASEAFARPKSQAGFVDDPMGNLGGLASPTPKKRNFFKKLMDTAKTGVATGRSNIITMSGTGSMQSMQSLQDSPMPLSMSNGHNNMSTGSGLTSSMGPKDPVREMGLAAGTDWVQVRRDVNRSNTLSRNERIERRDRCLMLDYPALDPVDELYGSIEGDEGIDGLPIRNPTDYQVINFMNVDKNSRFIKSLPPMTSAITLATTYVCRPYRSDVQRLRAIFTWVAEVICWEEDIEGVGKVDTRRVIYQKRACAEEFAVLVMEMCGAVGLHCEVVRGYLKTPGEIPETNMLPRPNHWWNAVLIDGEYRMIDCCLGSSSNPKRSLYSCVGSGSADFWYFLTRPSELCWTHMPEHHEQQHLCPPVAHETLLNLPCACPPYFINDLNMVDYNTSLTRIEDLEMVHIKFNVPADVEIAAEVETRALSRDSDGDFFESGDTVKKRALAQCEWFNGTKRYTVKALLPGDEGTGTLKIYAGKRGLMHSIKDIPHPMAFAIPIIHTGENPAYEFVTRHPTPHAQRHDIYVVQPQCQRLALNNTFVFAIRQHPSSAPEVETPIGSANPGRGASPIPFARPGSAMSISASSNPSSYSTGSGASKKPAKLAIQTPGGKILRLMRKEDRGRGVGAGSSGRVMLGDEEVSDGGTWETIIKCSEKGTWRGLVLADRIAKWCVFAEWHCLG